MAYVAVDKDGTEAIYNSPPERGEISWNQQYFGKLCILDSVVEVPPGTIRKIIGRDLTWSDDPVELTEEMMKPHKH